MNWNEADAGEYLLAIGALGTTAFALVDASKAFWGGVSNYGWHHIRKAMDKLIGKEKRRALGILKANWLNGMDIEAQKAAAKASVTKVGALTNDQLDDIIDESYHRADQEYRNSAKVWALIASVLLAIVGGWLVLGSEFNLQKLGICALVGLLATPLAPISKDLTSALQAGVKAMQFLKKPESKE